MGPHISTDRPADGALVSWYADDVAEPDTSDEAYGYWAFVVGSVLGVVGFALFLLSTTATKGTSAFWTYRSLSFSVGALALPVLMYGFVVVLPLRERATRVAYLGLAVSLLPAIGFLFAYPSNWNVDAGDLSPIILTGYALGIGIEVVAAFLFPAVSDEPVPAAATGPAGTDATPTPSESKATCTRTARASTAGDSATATATSSPTAGRGTPTSGTRGRASRSCSGPRPTRTSSSSSAVRRSPRPDPCRSTR